MKNLKVQTIKPCPCEYCRESSYRKIVIAGLVILAIAAYVGMKKLGL